MMVVGWLTADLMEKDTGRSTLLQMREKPGFLGRITAWLIPVAMLQLFLLPPQKKLYYLSMQITKQLEKTLP